MAAAALYGQALKSYRVDNFSGGLDVKRTALNLSRQKNGRWLTRADNLVLTTEGGITKRFGKVAINATTLGATVKILGGTQFRLSSGTDYQVVGTSDGRVVKILTDGTTANLATGKSTNAGVRYRFATYNDLLHITNGYDAPMTWDGTTFQNMAGSPPATGQVIVMHGNRAFMTARAVPSRLYWSALNNTVSWTGTTDAGFMDVEPNDNSILIDLVSSIQELAILKGRRPYRLQGIGPLTGYTVADHLVPTVGSVGGISSQGAVFALNDVFYVSELGLHQLTQTQQFGDLKEAFLSDRIEPYFRLDTDVSLSINQLNWSVLAYDSQANNLYVCVDSNNDGANDTTLCYDMVLKAWTVWPSTPFASLFTVRHPTTGAREVWAGGYDGFVYSLTRSSGSTEPISGVASFITDLGEPGVQKSLRYGFFYFTTESGSVTAHITTTFDFGATGGQVYDVNLSTNPPIWGGSFVWGTSVWGAGGEVSLIKRVDLSGLGEVVEISVSNLEPAESFTLLGFELFYRDRRHIRRPRS
jgi:hypothetical protein